MNSYLQIVLKCRTETIILKVNNAQLAIKWQTVEKHKKIFHLVLERSPDILIDSDSQNKSATWRAT